jgi:protease-4
MTEQKPNRTAAWTLTGVIVGFMLPLILCVCVTAATFAGLGSLGASNTNTTPAFAGQRATISPVHVSGPLTGPAVALVDVSGPIVTGDGAEQFDLTGGATAQSGAIVRAIRAAARDNNVKAIVLRINSPGGSVVASDEIYKALKDSGKPVVAQMGETAASGGYYVAMAAKHIVAHPDTTTGSIGVIYNGTNIEGLYEKLGLKSVIVKSAENKDIGNPTVPFTEEDRKIFQTLVDEIYDGFLTLVSDSRGIGKEELRKIADGRIYTGKQALALKLVDSLGYEQDAIDKAASLGGISGEPRVVQFRRQTPFAALFGQTLARTILQAFGIPMEAVTKTTPTLEYR